MATLTVNRLAQTITFAALRGQRVDTALFSLTVTASSGLPVSFSSSNAAVATVSSNTVILNGIGSTTITASQAGDATYLPASSVNQTLAVAGIPVGISSQPTGLTVNVTATATFTVTATGTDPLAYQWRKNGVIISSATNSSYSLPSVLTNQAGNYTVVITNTWGSVTSSVAALTVTAVSGAPVVVLPIADFAVSEDAASVVRNLTLTFSDVLTPAVSLLYAVVGNTNVSLVTAMITDGTNLTMAFTTNGNGNSQVAVSATDADGLSVTNTFVVTVTAVNDAPRFAAWNKTVVAWGWNSYGQANVPTTARSGMSAIAASGSHTVALKADGSVVAWGRNSEGQTTVPAGLSGVTAIAAGAQYTVALKADGSVVAWGDNGYGQTNVPAGVSGVSALAAGWYHTVALKADGSVAAWGRNDFGQANVPPAAQSGVIAIAAGGFHTVALKVDGSVVAWGWNAYGQTTVPAGLSGVIAMAASESHTVALKADGSVVAWGNNSQGQTTVPTVAQSGVIAIAGGGHHTVALKTNGSVVAWGGNGNGQTTVPTAAQSRVSAIAAGFYHTVALTTVPLAITVTEDSGAYAGGANVASAISPGPANESAQTVAFTVTNDNNALFSVQPAINADGTLTFTPALNMSGSATVTVVAQDDDGTNNGGVDTSAAQTFTITVTPGNAAPPSITSQPASATNSVGSSAAFSVTTTGSGPLVYQWRKDGVILPGANSATLVFTPTNRAFAGAYSVVVTNAFGSVTSSNAVLRVLVPQRIERLEKLAGGTFKLRFSDVDGGLLVEADKNGFTLQWSANLVNWFDLTNVTRTVVNGTVELEDADAAGQARRFYRVLER